jgi:hypothetical protein
MDGQPDDGLFVVVNFPAFERDEINQAVETFIWVQLGAMLLAGHPRPVAGRTRPSAAAALVDTARRISTPTSANASP